MDMDSSVALLAEGVDRNNFDMQTDGERKRSPSSRRAWIEILRESRWQPPAHRRPPRGGRG